VNTIDPEQVEQYVRKYFSQLATSDQMIETELRMVSPRADVILSHIPAHLVLSALLIRTIDRLDAIEKTIRDQNA